MTRSLIRLDNTVRASLNTGLNDKVHDETRVKADVRTNVDNDGITKGYNEWDWEDDSITNSYSGYNEKLWSYNDDAMTETDSDITESYNEMGKGVGTNTNNDDITRGYN